MSIIAAATQLHGACTRPLDWTARRARIPCAVRALRAPQRVTRQALAAQRVLQRVVDQFVVHYDVCGIAKQCFNVLHDHRGLSVHFMLDLDGTIYQTLDLKERAFHATTSNHRSIGIEIANMGAYGPGDTKVLDEWYPRDAAGKPFVKVPEKLGDPLIRTKDFTARPARPDPVRGVVQGQELVQYDLTPEQYAALIKLTAALATRGALAVGIDIDRSMLVAATPKVSVPEPA